jgi:hypothetical protein
MTTAAIERKLAITDQQPHVDHVCFFSVAVGNSIFINQQVPVKIRIHIDPMMNAVDWVAVFGLRVGAKGRRAPDFHDIDDRKSFCEHLLVEQAKQFIASPRGAEKMQRAIDEWARS